jgi:hypothetical protein
MMEGLVSEEKPRMTSAPRDTFPPENTSDTVPGHVSVSPAPLGPDTIKPTADARARWEPHMRRTPFSDHEDADIARWSI